MSHEKQSLENIKSLIQLRIEGFEKQISQENNHVIQLTIDTLTDLKRQVEIEIEMLILKSFCKTNK